MSEKAPEDGIRLSAHPRARRQIAMAKGWGGLAAFALVVWLSTRAGVPTGDALLRGLAGGIAGYLVCWMVAVAVWKQIALAELESLKRTLLNRMEQQAAHAAAAQGGGQPTDGGAVRQG
jgi:hypothetical protein